MTRVAVLGDSEAGAQIGCEYALGGCSVIWLTNEQERSAQRAEGVLRLASTRGLAGPADLERARALISHAAPGDGSEGRLTLILEVLPERLEEKAAALAPLAAAHPEALLATTGETITATALGEAAGAAERIVTTRYGSPPLLNPLVELLAARDTPPRLLDRVSQLLRAIGKRPVLVRREVPGMIGARLELALLRECASLLERGVADAAAIDEVVRDGLARSWAVAGPLQAAELEGLRSLRAIAAEIEAEGAASPPGRDLLHSLPATEPALLEGLRERRDQSLAAALRAERDRAARHSGRAD
jgi:3-hydroxybutyryl-CoA dehydrogenase